MELQIDPEFKALIPPLSAEEYAQLEQNILADGCREALVVWESFEPTEQHRWAHDALKNNQPVACKGCDGRESRVEHGGDNGMVVCARCGYGHTPPDCYKVFLIDGHNRYEICKRHGVEYETTSREFENRDAVKVWMLDNAFGQRNLNDLDKLANRQSKYELLKEKGREKYQATVGRPSKEKSLSKTDNDKHDSRKQIADELGWSTGKLARATIVLNEADDATKAKVRAGDISIHKAYSDIATAKRRNERLTEITRQCEGTPELPVEKYAVIYADPPWQFDHQKSDTRKVTNQYPTMTTDAICDLDIKSIATDPAALFLWVPNSMVPEGLRVTTAWGFKYVTHFIWRKDKIGMGHWVRNQHEILFVCKRGDMPPPNGADRFASVIDAPRLGHSEKPLILYEMIEKMYPDVPRVELFCRRPRENWAVWGNQVGAA